MPDDRQANLKIEPLDPDIHDRAAFSCGVERLDNFFKRTANKHQKGNFSRVWVAVGDDPGTVLGYYAINAHSLEHADLPKELLRGAPRNGIPAAYLSMIAVSADAQGQGLGRLLLVDALKKVLQASDALGLAAIVLDVLDEDGPEAFEGRMKFYLSMGFKPFPSRPSRLFLTIKTIAKLFAEDEAS